MPSKRATVKRKLSKSDLQQIKKMQKMLAGEPALIRIKVVPVLLAILESPAVAKRVRPLIKGRRLSRRGAEVFKEYLAQLH